MTKTSLIRLAAIFVTALTLIAVAGARHGRRDGSSTPIVLAICPAIPSPGQNVSIEVDLSSAPAQDQVVTISTLTPGNWSYLPTQVTVPAGQTSVVFSGQVSPYAVGILNGIASCNNGYAYASVPIAAL